MRTGRNDLVPCRIPTELWGLALALSTGGMALAEEPARSASAEESLANGVAYLVGSQNEDGSWGSARQTKGLNIYAPVPGSHHAFRVAVTAMGVMALIESGLAESGDAAAAREKAEAFLIAELPQVRRANADAIYNVWTHGFGLEALVRMHERQAKPDERLRLTALMNQQIDRLVRYESVDGGWGYYDFNAQTAKPSSSSTSFTTATILIALKKAEGIEGVVVPRSIVDRAIAALNRQRKSDLSYLYAEYLKNRPMYPINRPGGSLGRSQVCNLALRSWGDATIRDEDIGGWLEKLLERNGWLDMGRKRPIPHESWFQVAGYFYYYGHYYGAEIARLLPAEVSSSFRDRIAQLMIATQEKDGSWWDFPFYDYHKPYGTAFAILTLAACRG